MPFRLALLALAAAFAAIYGPDLGHGFVRDDFGWIDSSRVETPSDVARLFTQQPGFYRPLVSLTFSADYAIWHLNPLGYALTNLALFALVAALVYRVARTLTLPPAAALLAAAVWALDIHGPRMALLWISGRTALMLCVFALATADSVLRRRYKLAGVLCLLALLSKEEAALLPLVLSAFVVWDRRDRKRRAALRETWPLWAALAVYAVLRVNSGAFGPTTLPPHYPVVSDLRSFLRNLGEYAVRAGLVSAIAVLIVTFVARASAPLVVGERRALVFGALWFVGFFAITIFAANRSDLYALTPSIGSAFAAAAIAACAFRVRPKRFRIAATGLIAAVFALIPTYRLRDGRWVEPANVSANVMETLRTDTGDGARGRIVLVDDLAAHFGLESAFGTLLPEAVRLIKGPEWTADLRRSNEQCQDVEKNEGKTDVFVFRDGRLTRCGTWPLETSPRR